MALPSGYTQVEYIQSSGTQYINTGYSPSSNTKIAIDFYIENGATGTDQSVFACDDSWLNHNFSLFQSGIAYGDQYQAFTSSGLSGRYTAELDSGVLTLNGTASNTITTSAFTTTTQLTLLAQNRQGTISNYMVGKLYSCKIYESGTLIRDFVPCTNSSGTASLYDVVNGVFYANAGSGTFTAGSVVRTAGNTLIDGTGYEIKSGKCLVDGTEYSIKKGRTLVDGTGYDIIFGHTWQKYSVAISPVYTEEDYYVYFTGDLGYYCHNKIEAIKYGTSYVWNLPTYSSRDDYITNNGYRSNRYFGRDQYPTEMYYCSTLQSVSTITGTIYHPSVSKKYTLTGVENVCGTYIEDVISTDKNAYPDNGEQDGYWYVKIS